MKIRTGILRRFVALALVGFASQMVCRAQLFSVNCITNNGAGNNPIGVRFATAVLLPSATNAANYQVNGGAISVTGASLDTNGVDVRLTLGSPVAEFFVVAVSNVLNLASNVINDSVTGYMSEQVSATVGPTNNPAPGDVFSSYWDSFKVTVGGAGIGGTSDHFQFTHAAYVGDFDAQILVKQLDAASPLAQAGLMARESLATNSACIHTLFTPTTGTNEIQLGVRATTGTNTTDAGFQIGPRASATPLRMVRLTRTGNIFSAYHSTNGSSWLLSGISTQAFATTMLVGFAVSSHTTNATTTAACSDLYVTGVRPGAGIVPALSASVAGTNLNLVWPITPRSYAVQVSTNLTEWALLCEPTLQTNSTQRSMRIPLGPGAAFYRLTLVDRLIPVIAGITYNPGTILSPGAGLSSSNVTGSVWCTNNVVNTTTVFALTDGVATIPSGKVGTFHTTPSDSVDTLLKLRNPAFTEKCDDNSADGVLKSRVLTSAFSSASGNFTALMGAKTGTSPTAVIKLRIDY